MWNNELGGGWKIDGDKWGKEIGIKKRHNMH
jgi:hypothetical protein